MEGGYVLTGVDGGALPMLHSLPAKASSTLRDRNRQQGVCRVV